MQGFPSILTAILLLIISSHALHTMEPEDKPPFSYNKFLFSTYDIPMIFPISDNPMIFPISTNGKPMLFHTRTEAEKKFLYDMLCGKHAKNSVNQYLLEYRTNPERIQERKALASSNAMMIKAFKEIYGRNPMEYKIDVNVLFNYFKENPDSIEHLMKSGTGIYGRIHDPKEMRLYNTYYHYHNNEPDIIHLPAENNTDFYDVNEINRATLNWPNPENYDDYDLEPEETSPAFFDTSHYKDQNIVNLSIRGAYDHMYPTVINLVKKQTSLDDTRAKDEPVFIKHSTEIKNLDHFNHDLLPETHSNILIKVGANLNIWNAPSLAIADRTYSCSMLDIIKPPVQNITNLNVLNNSSPKDKIRALCSRKLDTHNNMGSVRLHNACFEKDLEKARLTLSQGINVDVVDHKKKTPLYYACLNGNVEMAELLINHNANIKARDNNGNTLLHMVSCKGHLEIAKLLIKKDPTVVNVRNRFGQTPLYCACYEGDVEMAELLITHRGVCQTFCVNGFNFIKIR